MSEVKPISLAGIRADLTAKYAPVPVDIGEGETVRLLQLARLGETKERQLLDHQAAFHKLQTEARELEAAQRDGESVDPERIREFKREGIAKLEEMIVIVAETEASGRRLVEACAGDQMVLMEVFKRYSKGAQLGEASASPDSSESTAGHSGTTSVPSSDSSSETS